MSITFASEGWNEYSSQVPSEVRHIDADNVHLIAGPKTDWWRTAQGSEPESAVSRNSGPVYAYKLDAADQNWVTGVYMAGTFAERFQQATLFVGIGDCFSSGNRSDRDDQTDRWLKAGYEMEDGRQMIGSVATANFSDWAIAPSPGNITSELDGSRLYVQIQKHGPDLIISYALSHDITTPPASLTLLREVKGFLADVDVQTPLYVGIMACGPLSESTAAVFSSFTLAMS